MGLDFEGFRAWLASRAPNTVVGHMWTSTDCALSHYLNDTRGGRWSVGCCAVDVAGENGRASEPLPAWAWTFMEKVDRLRSVQQSQDAVTAREALRILDSIDSSQNVGEMVDLTKVSSERQLAMARHPSSIGKHVRERASA